jgi:hypothetical protein
MSSSTSVPLDPIVAKVLDRERNPQEDEDEDELLAELEKEDSSLDAFRERRLQQLHEEFVFFTHQYCVRSVGWAVDNLIDTLEHAR